MQVVNWQTRRHKIIQTERLDALFAAVFGLLLRGRMAGTPEPAASAIVKDGPLYLVTMDLMYHGASIRSSL
jgi:hypothetical protein